MMPVGVPLWEHLAYANMYKQQQQQLQQLLRQQQESELRQRLTSGFAPPPPKTRRPSQLRALLEQQRLPTTQFAHVPLPIGMTYCPQLGAALADHTLSMPSTSMSPMLYTMTPTMPVHMVSSTSVSITPEEDDFDDGPPTLLYCGAANREHPPALLPISLVDKSPRRESRAKPTIDESESADASTAALGQMPSQQAPKAEPMLSPRALLARRASIDVLATEKHAPLMRPPVHRPPTSRRLRLCGSVADSPRSMTPPKSSRESSIGRTARLTSTTASTANSASGDAQSKMDAVHTCSWGECSVTFDSEELCFLHVVDTHMTSPSTSSSLQSARTRRAQHRSPPKVHYTCAWQACGACKARGTPTERHDWLREHVRTRHFPKYRPHACLYENCALRFATIPLLQAHMTSGHRPKMSTDERERIERQRAAKRERVIIVHAADESLDMLDDFTVNALRRRRPPAPVVYPQSRTALGRSVNYKAHMKKMRRTSTSHS